MMKPGTKIGLCFLGIVILCVGLPIAWSAWRARRPRNMPSDSIWIDAPAIPFGFYRGWWLGCWIDSDHVSNRCRFWGSGGLGVVYEGLYVSCDNRVPVSVDQLKLTPQEEVTWVKNSQGSTAFAPVVYLWNGKVLVPSAAPQACEELQQRKVQR